MSASIIAIDAMGGDFGPHCIVPACISALAEFPSLHLAGEPRSRGTFVLRGHTAVPVAAG